LAVRERKALVAFVIPEEFVIYRPASGEAIRHLVPKRDARFAALPAEQNLFTVVKRGEVNQAGIEIFELAAYLLEPFYRRFENLHS
jgi:hypothetical protein